MIMKTMTFEMVKGTAVNHQKLYTVSPPSTDSTKKGSSNCEFNIFRKSVSVIEHT